MNAITLNNTTAIVTPVASQPETMAQRIANGIQHTIENGQEFAVDHTLGSLDGRVSSEWSSRGDDERFLSLDSLYDRVYARSHNAVTQIVETQGIRLITDRDNLDSLAIEYRDHNGSEQRLTPSHHSFGQLAALAQCPAGFLRELPAPIAAIPLQYRLQSVRENVKTYFRPDSAELMAVNGPDFGRIKDYVLVDQVRQLVDRNPAFKIPGMMNWAAGTYNPFVEPTKQSTTLYASDHDVFMFLVDDTHPIEIGKTAKGNPDLLFPGFYAWNGENGGVTAGADFMYLRGVCMNRNLWGVEEATRVKVRHTKNAPLRFAREITPALQDFTNVRASAVVGKVLAAKSAIVARDDDERVEFLSKRGFSKKAVADVLAAHVNEEERPAESVWDMVQAITAHARKTTHTDARLDLEKRAGALMDKVAA